ncbi:hypothetical protein [Candidatus Uabimicrobium sp. HlEnr_7]|uniref:hypothetical protein n=1 Tax=Candidatus Uabimicrobium helgolandensis TaxID=3095367 RepID=UPI003558FCBB
MKNIAMWPILLYLLVGVCLSADDWSVEERLPENTLFLVTFPDLQQSQTALEETSIAKLLHDPQLQRVATELITPYQELIAPYMMQYNQAVDQVQQIALGEVTIAITGMNRGGQIPVEAVICVEIKSGMEMAQQGLAMLEGKVQQDEQGYHVDGMAHFKFIGNHLVAATSMELLQQIEVGSGANLKNNASYQNTKSKVQKNHIPGVFIFINTHQLYQTFSPMIPKREVGLVKNLGIDKLNGIAMAVNIAGDHLHDAIFIDYPGNTVIKDLATMLPVSQELLQNIPQNASLVLGLNFNLKDFLNKFEKLIIAVDPSGREIKGFRRELESGKRELGIDIKNDLGTLFGEIGLFQYTNNTTGLFPHTILSAKCSDPITLGKLLGLLGKEANISSHKTSYRGNTLYYFSVNAKRRWGGYAREDELIAMSLFFASMGFYFDNGYIYIGEVHSLKDYIQQREQSQDGITSSKNFKNAMDRLSVKNPSFLMYQDVRSSLAAYWNLFLPMLRSLEGYARAAGIPLDTALLPDGETLANYFSPTGMGFTTTNEGLMLESYTHMGGLKLAALPIFAVFLIEEGLPYRQRRQIKRSIGQLVETLEDMIRRIK